MRLVLLFALLAASASAQDRSAGDSALVALIEAHEAGTLSTDRASMLLAVALQQPDRIQAIGYDPTALRAGIVHREDIRALKHGAPPMPRVWPVRDGDADSLFAAALQRASSDRQRADFYYARGQSPYGSSDDFDRAIELHPTHGPSLYRLAGVFAHEVGRPSEPEGRAEYWCLADRYRHVAEFASDEQIVENARRAAAGDERAAPTREQVAALGWRSGQTVTVAYGDDQTCETTVR